MQMCSVRVSLLLPYLVLSPSITLLKYAIPMRSMPSTAILSISGFKLDTNIKSVDQYNGWQTSGSIPELAYVICANEFLLISFVGT